MKMVIWGFLVTYKECAKAVQLSDPIEKIYNNLSVSEMGKYFRAGLGK